MKTTAVEWLLKILEGQKDKPFNYEEWLIAFNHAKEMEKQQIIDAWHDGQNDHEREVEMYAFGEEYYNDMIKSEENGK